MKFKMLNNTNGDDLMENGVTKMSEKVKVPVWFDQWLSDHGNTDRIELIKAIINNAHEKISLIVNDKAHPVADQDKLKFISAILNGYEVDKQNGLIGGQCAAITGEQIVSGTVSADKIALNINTKAPRY